MRSWGDRPGLLALIVFVVWVFLSAGGLRGAVMGLIAVVWLFLACVAIVRAVRRRRASP